MPPQQWSSSALRTRRRMPQPRTPPPYPPPKPSQLTISRYYGLSIILGTVAISYGSVPMYKMACLLPRSLLLHRLHLPSNSHFQTTPPTNPPPADMPTNRLGRPTHPINHTFLLSLPPRPRHNRLPPPNNLQRLRLRHPPLEIHSPTTRSASPARGNRPRILHRHKHLFGRYNRRSNVQRVSGPSRALLQQDPVFLLRGAAAGGGGNGGYAGFLLRGSGVCE